MGFRIFLVACWVYVVTVIVCTVNGTPSNLVLFVLCVETVVLLISGLICVTCSEFNQSHIPRGRRK